MRRAVQMCGKNVANWFHGLWDNPLSRRPQGYISATLLLGTCFATTYCMGLFSKQYDLYGACNSVWEAFCEYASIVL